MPFQGNILFTMMTWTFSRFPRTAFPLMISLRTLSVLEFTGHDARQFLHNQLSADISSIPVGGSGFACCCNPAGRVLGLLLVHIGDDTVLAVCAAELSAMLNDWLSRFIIRADVRIVRREDLAVVQGTESVSGETSPVATLASGPGYLIVPAGSAGPGSEEQLAAWQVEELRSGVVWLDSSSSGEFLPQMLGYESIGALNFKKGCYPGQEIIARTRYLGKLKRHPVLLHVAGLDRLEPLQKVELHQGENSHPGVVVQQVSAETGVSYLLVVVRAPEVIRADAITVDGTRFPAL
jgi:folate-binding protein YgfZ